MGSVTLRNLLGTYVSEGRATAVNDPSAYMYVRAWSGQACHSYVYFSRPFPLGATITSAKLYLTFAPKPISGTLNVTASRLKETARFSSMTYNNRPTSIYSGSAATGSLTGTWAGARTLEIDITGQMQAVSDGDKWYGYRLTSDWSNTGWAPKFASPQSATPTHRPYVVIEWSDAPDAPTSLAPSGGHVVSTPTPTVRFDYTDVSGSTDLARARVQISTSSSFTAPVYDSGDVDVDTPQWTPTGFVAASMTTYYWRVRVQDAAGLWSAWSAATTFKYKALPTLNLINPPDAGADWLSTVGDPTPPIIWSSAGQTSYEVALWANRPTPPPVYRSIDFKLALPGNVMQYAFRDEVTDQWFITQAQAGSQPGRETTVITRTDAKGRYLDRMVLVDAGHGTHFALENVAGTTYFWTQWRTYDTPTGPMTGRDVYRFAYAPNVSREVTDPGVTKVIDNAGTTNMQVWNDQTNDRLVTSAGGAYKLYAFSDVKDGGLPTATQIGVTITGIGLEDVVQGNSVWKDILFRYSGTQSQSDTPMLRAYSFTTGALLWEYDTSQVGGYTKGTAEPESVYVTGGSNGLPVAFVGWSAAVSGGRQSSVYAMEVADIQAAADEWDPVKVWDTGKTKGTDQSRTVPSGKITKAGRYSVHVYAYDNEQREAVPNGKARAEVTRRFTFTNDPTVDGVDSLEALPLDPLPGIHLIWERSEAPDSFTILRDGEVVVDSIDPADPDYEATVGELRWHWVDRFPVKNTGHTYQVQAVVNGKSSATNTPVTAVNAIRGTWILDDTQVGGSAITCQLVNDKERTMEYGEQSEVYEVLGASSVSLVTQTMRGYQGQISGEIRDVPGVDGSIGYWVRRMLALKGTPGRKVWLMLQGMTFPAVLQNVQVYRLPEAEEAWGVSFQFYQQGGLNYTPKL